MGMRRARQRLSQAGQPGAAVSHPVEAAAGREHRRRLRLRSPPRASRRQKRKARWRGCGKRSARQAKNKRAKKGPWPGDRATGSSGRLKKTLSAARTGARWMRLPRARHGADVPAGAGVLEGPGAATHERAQRRVRMQNMNGSLRQGRRSRELCLQTGKGGSRSLILCHDKVVHPLRHSANKKARADVPLALDIYQGAEQRWKIQG